MSQALVPTSFTMHVAGRVAASRPRRSPRIAWSRHEDAARLRRMRSLVALFLLYAVALVALVVASDAADIGCVLTGIAGHVLYAAHRVVGIWSDAASLEGAKARALARLLPASPDGA